MKILRNLILAVGAMLGAGAVLAQEQAKPATQPEASHRHAHDRHHGEKGCHGNGERGEHQKDEKHQHDQR